MGNDRLIIGVDESGKGDFFGPLVIASFCAPDSERSSLLALDVRDSKTIAENKLLRIDETLRAEYPHEVIIVGPEKYNDLHARMRNLNKMLAWGHARAIENLLESQPAELAISDKFGKTELIENALFKKGRSIEIQQLVRGEKIIQVAAASILARAAFINQMRRLSDRFERSIPRGAGPLVDQAARGLVKDYGPEILNEIAKLHFKNYQRVVNPTLFA